MSHWPRPRIQIRCERHRKRQHNSLRSSQVRSSLLTKKQTKEIVLQFLMPQTPAKACRAAVIPQSARQSLTLATPRDTSGVWLQDFVIPNPPQSPGQPGWAWTVNQRFRTRARMKRKVSSFVRRENPVPNVSAETNSE